MKSKVTQNLARLSFWTQKVSHQVEVQCVVQLGQNARPVLESERIATITLSSVDPVWMTGCWDPRLSESQELGSKWMDEVLLGGEGGRTKQLLGRWRNQQMGYRQRLKKTYTWERGGGGGGKERERHTHTHAHERKSKRERENDPLTIL